MRVLGRVLGRRKHAANGLNLCLLGTDSYPIAVVGDDHHAGTTGLTFAAHSPTLLLMQEWLAHAGELARGPVDRGGQGGTRAADRAMYRMAGRVALEDLADASREGESLAGGPGGHVGVDQRVHDWAVLALEGGQLGRMAAFLGLERRAGVIGHQAAEAVIDAEGLQVPGAVQRMQPGGHQRRGIADVVQPRSGDQEVALVIGEHGRHTRPACSATACTCAQRSPSGSRRLAAWSLAHREATFDHDTRRLEPREAALPVRG
jgi:hypothetical protein